MTGRRIIVGITGGIAAYKTLTLIRLLVKQGDEVQVIATESALNFIGASTIEALSRNVLQTDLFQGVSEVRHVALGQNADLVVIAPATANTIAQFAQGLAPDLLTNTLLTTTAPILLAPAMHSEMWNNPATRANIDTLRSRGIHIIGPETGQLTGDDSGVGRVSEPEDILATINNLLAVNDFDFSNRKVLVTAGGTREPLDPVRYLGNRSSGKQGVAVAERARDRGAEVTLIALNLEVPVPYGVRVVHASSTAELSAALDVEAPNHELIVMAAAVSDFRPHNVVQSKLKKTDIGDEFELKLVKNPDLLAEMVRNKRAEQVFIGFAAETATAENLLELGRKKIQAKGADLLVVNHVSWSEGFGKDSNTVTILNLLGEVVAEKSAAKTEVADEILTAGLKLFKTLE